MICEQDNKIQITKKQPSLITLFKTATFGSIRQIKPECEMEEDISSNNSTIYNYILNTIKWFCKKNPIKPSHSSNQLSRRSSHCIAQSDNPIDYLLDYIKNGRFESNQADSSLCNPPSRYGLENCEPIIPSYYFTNHDYNTIFQIDYYHIILDDIRNMRPLNNYQIDCIRSLDQEKKMEIIEEFHKINSFMIETAHDKLV